jgi:Kdo2-lipid IVA lauroyltransferase/acyltransferase
MSGPNVKFAHRAEAALVWLLIRALRPLSPATASRIGSAAAGFIGPFIPTSKTADKNLALAMPELNAAQRKQTVKECWQSLGATAAELVNIGKIQQIPLDAPGPGFTVIGWHEHAAPAIAAAQAAGGPTLFFTGHIGNWEILPAAGFAHGVDIGFMYRAASNPLVNNMIMSLRESNFQRKLTMFAKGAPGGRAAYTHLLKGGILGLLVDQKLDTGLPIPFFGHTAMTMDALATFALKFRCPVIPAYVTRIAPARFHVTCEAPLALPASDDKQQNLTTLTTIMNQTLERGIRTTPGAWLWLHRRWPKGTLAK